MICYLCGGYHATYEYIQVQNVDYYDRITILVLINRTPIGVILTIMVGIINVANSDVSCCYDYQPNLSNLNQSNLGS